MLKISVVLLLTFATIGAHAAERRYLWVEGGHDEIFCGDLKTGYVAPDSDCKNAPTPDRYFTQPNPEYRKGIAMAKAKYPQGFKRKTSPELEAAKAANRITGSFKVFEGYLAAPGAGHQLDSLAREYHVDLRSVTTERNLSGKLLEYRVEGSEKNVTGFLKAVGGTVGPAR